MSKRTCYCLRPLAFVLVLIMLALHSVPNALAAPEATAQGAAPPPERYYEEDVSASNPLRSEQVRELDAYIRSVKQDKTRLHHLFTPDYSSPASYEASTRRLRQEFSRSIGYPPPGKPDLEPLELKRIGDDTLAVYYRARISILPGVHAEGLYIVPKGRRGRVPLIIAMHGGGGSPEVALFHGGANYHDMVRGGVKRGYVVFAPQHLFSAEGFPGDIRDRVDDRMRLIGTSLTAIEIAKITRALDALVRRPEIDPRRIAMVGLSYGGYYALVTAALEPRIKAVVSSCYFGVQEGRYERDELSVPTDFRFTDRFTLFRDSEIVALICPRPLQIQAGSRDDSDHREPGKAIAPDAAQYYNSLGRGRDFQFTVFEGGHDFYDEPAWEFLRERL